MNKKIGTYEVVKTLEKYRGKLQIIPLFFLTFYTIIRCDSITSIEDYGLLLTCTILIYKDNISISAASK